LFLAFFLLFTFPLVVLAQENANHDCPGSNPPNCKEVDETAVIDIAPLWGEVGCPMFISYKYRICFSNNKYTFEIIKNPLEEYVVPDPDCSAIFYGLVKNDFIISTLADIYISEQLLDITAKKIANSYSQSAIDKYSCKSGNSYLAGTYYYGFCSQTWWGVKFETVNGEHKAKKFIKYSGAFCGSECCFRYQEFCFLPGSTPSNPILQSSKPIIASNWGAGTIACDQPFGTAPIIPGVVWYKHDNCASACDIGVGKIEKPTHSIVEQFSKEELKKESLVDIFYQNKSITVNFMQPFSGEISIFDLNGKKIVSKAVVNSNGEHLFDASNFENGLYIVYLRNSKQSIVKKIFCD
jgi:hypothetical protein